VWAVGQALALSRHNYENITKLKSRKAQSQVLMIKSAVYRDFDLEFSNTLNMMWQSE
jgi:hypothetical protein